MSNGTRLQFADAYRLAERLTRELAPVTRRSKTAGSLRRRRSDVGDIEIVVEPLERELIGATEPDLDAIRQVASKWGQMSGGNRMITVRLREPAGFKVELYIVTPPANWNCILAIRTGPARLGAEVMRRLNGRGYEHTRGHITRRDTGQIVPVPDEETFFALAGLPCLPPSRRDSAAAGG